MSNVFFVGNSVEGFDVSNRFNGYSRVVVIVSEEIAYTAGNETGRTLTLNCPWATQETADDILERLAGFQYQPYVANNAFVDPAAEIGDGVRFSNVSSGLYSINTRFNSLFTSDISAPIEEEIEHEFPYVPKQEKIISRKFSEIKSELSIQADQISAKVSSSGGDSSSFGWKLDSDSWEISSGSQVVFFVSKDGAEVNGKITATSGKIGGFDIGQSELSYNNQTWKGTNAIGAYIGTNGIQLGKNFRVDMQGNLYAASGEFSGNVKAGKILYGGSSGTVSGAAISPGTVTGGQYGSLAISTLSNINLTDGINVSLGSADFAAGVFGGWNQSEWLKTKRFSLGDYNAGWTTIKYLDHNGNKRSLRVCSGQ